MRILTALAVTLLLIWSAGWFAAARGIERAAETWFAETAAAGLTADYAFLQVTGFPARLTLEVEAPHLADPFAGLGWQTDMAEASVAAPRLDRLTLSLPAPQRIALPDQTLLLSGADIAATLTLALPAGTLRRADATGRTLRLEGAGWHATLAALDTGLATDPARPEVLHLTATLEDLSATLPTTALPELRRPAAADTPPPTTARLTRATLELQLTFDQPPLAAPPAAPPRLQSLQVDAASLATPAGRLTAHGDLTIDAEGYPEGTLTLGLERWRALLAETVEQQLMEPEIARTWEAALPLMAGTDDSSEATGRLDLPLRFARGRIRLGPLPLGPAPQLAPPLEAPDAPGASP